MKRREILTRLVQSAAAITIVHTMPALTMQAQESLQREQIARLVSSWKAKQQSRKETVRRMTTETPAQAWASRSGHGSTLVYFGDGPAFEVTFQNQTVLITARYLSASERKDLRAYQKEIDPHVPQSLGTIVGNGEWRLRGWIYNGRYSDRWIISVEKI